MAQPSGPCKWAGWECYLLRHETKESRSRSLRGRVWCRGDALIWGYAGAEGLADILANISADLQLAGEKDLNLN